LAFCLGSASGRGSYQPSNSRLATRPSSSVGGRTLLAMNLQNRGKRWLAAVDVAKAMSGKIIQSEAEFRAKGRPFPDQAHDVTIKGFFALRLTAEADPIPPDSPLHEVITDVLTALDALKVGPEFRKSMEAFGASLHQALGVLREYTADDDSNIDEIISSLERAFMVSLLITLTSHHFVNDWDGKWQHHHQRFVNGHVVPDFGHYIEIKSGFLPCDEPGPGRVHAQHIHSALVAGTTVWVAAAGKQDVDYYPEFQSIIYSQWFAYMHAIWDEQYRGRIARLFDSPEERIRKRDVINDFFGDIRLIRNDYVHNKGIADEALNTRLLKWASKGANPLTSRLSSWFHSSTCFRGMS